MRRITVIGSEAPSGQSMWFRLLTLPKLWSKHTLPKPFGADLRGLGPIHVCPCGSQVFNVMCAFEDNELVWWFLDGTCASCGNLVTVPCPADSE